MREAGEQYGSNRTFSAGSPFSHTSFSQGPHLNTEREMRIKCLQESRADFGPERLNGSLGITYGNLPCNEVVIHLFAIGRVPALVARAVRRSIEDVNAQLA
jgi:hypothetical protein